MGDRVLELWDSVPDAEALSGRDRVAVIARTASALRNAGNNERALALVDAALAETHGLAPSRHARLLRDKGQYLANLNRPGTAELFESALALLPESTAPTDDPLRQHLLTELAAQRMLAAEFTEAIDTARAAIAEAQDAPAALRSVAHNILASSLVGSGRIAEGFAEFEIASDLAAGDAGATLRYATNASDALNSVGRYADAVRLAEGGVARARERGVERSSGIWLAANTAEPLIALGEFDRAEDMLRIALGFDDRAGLCAQLQRARLWVWHGEAERADALLRRFRVQLHALAQLEQQTRLSLARISAEVAIGLGDFERAWVESRGLGAEPFRSMPGYDLPVLASAARSLAELAAREVSGATPPDRARPDVLHEAQRLGAVLEALRGWPTAAAWAPIVEAELATARATVSGIGDRHDRYAEAEQAWSLASIAATQPVAPVHLHPYALLRAARVSLAAGDRARADALIAEGRALAERSGIRLLVQAADALLRRQPGRSADSAATHGQPLTEREEQVLALIEQGLSNKQIGEKLYISAKTASVHVSSILRKVGASSRTEAVYRASRPVP
jgi:DNA-binding CsgD family transcriptional regulator